jgi:hypothetical protein
VVATEDIDARDWMQAHSGDELSDAVSALLGGKRGLGTLCDNLGRDLWIDYVADTGDDADLSAAVADMLFRSYRVDGELLGRGEVLLFGGDTAYPVATDIEIHNRVCVPFNRVLIERQDGKPRVLLGIPGNHDWYDGLDGFVRMFRARRGSVDRASMLPDDEVDTGGPIGHLVDWVEAFRVGQNVAKREALPLLGYVPVQSASYWCLRLAPRLDAWGVDRQLRTVDYTQRGYFMQERQRGAGAALMLVLSDPVFTMLEPYAIGHSILESLDLDLEEDAALVLSGDTHHYCRTDLGESMHVVAGGGGAFLHPARIARRGFDPPAAEFPGPRASLALALQVPWQIAAGRSGFICHVAAALVYLPVLTAQLAEGGSLVTSVVIGVLVAITCGLLGGWRKKRSALIGVLAMACGAWVGALPYLVELVLHRFAPSLSLATRSLYSYGLSIYPAVLGFGTFLMVLTIAGLEQHQAFSALAHPGYKHFMRLRVRRDGSAVDGWVIGKVDPLDADAPVVLIDRYRWDNPRAVPASASGGDEERQ